MIRANPSNAENDRRHKISVLIDNLQSGITQNLFVQPFTTIGQLKSIIESQTGLNTSRQRLFSQHCEMRNSDFITDYISSKPLQPIKEFSFDQSIGCDFSVQEENIEIQLIPKQLNSIGSIQIIREFNNPQIEKTVVQIQKGINKGLKPLQVEDGVSGSYFLRDQYRNNIAIFKCIDEEPFAPNNQKGYKNCFGEFSFRDGIKSGEVCLREMAAFYLDDKKIHQVPTTTIVEMKHPYFQDKFQYQLKIKKGFFKSKFLKMMQNSQKKLTKIGSLQKLVINNGSVDNISNTLFSIYEVQKIALLDLRILNDDRHEGNILFQRNHGGDIKLIPIDHGLSMPDNLQVKNYNICWYFWKQIQEPIHQILKNYILQIDPLKNYKLLKRKLDIRSECLRNLRISEIFLKKCVEANLTIKQITDFVYLQDDQIRSTLQKIVEQAEFLYLRMKSTLKHRKEIFQSILQIQERLNMNESIKYKVRQRLNSDHNPNVDLQVPIKMAKIQQYENQDTTDDGYSKRKRSLSTDEFHSLKEFNISQNQFDNEYFYYLFECQVVNFLTQKQKKRIIQYYQIIIKYAINQITHKGINSFDKLDNIISVASKVLNTFHEIYVNKEFP